MDNTAKRSGLGNVVSGEDATLSIIGNVVNVILGFVGIIFFILVFTGGFKWMTSQGNEEQVTEAKNTIKTAVIGIAVVFASFLITNFVLNQIKNVNDPNQLGRCDYAASNSECADPGQSTIWTGRTDDITQEQCKNKVKNYRAECRDEWEWTP